MGYFHLFTRIALAMLNSNAWCQSSVTNTKVNTQSSVSCASSFTVKAEKFSGSEISATTSALGIFSLRLSLPLPTLLCFTVFIKNKAEFWNFTWIAINFSTIFTSEGLYFFFNIIQNQLFACCLKFFSQGIIQIEFHWFSLYLCVSWHLMWLILLIIQSSILRRLF